MNEAKRELLGLLKELRETDPAGFLSVVAVSRVITGREGMEPPPGYTRGDYKRAIKVCREIQSRVPQEADRIEEAISMIRRDWLHREGGERMTTKYPNLLKAATIAAQEARETFPERFMGRTDQEIISEIAAVVQGAANTEDGDGAGLGEIA